MMLQPASFVLRSFLIFLSLFALAVDEVTLVRAQATVSPPGVPMGNIALRLDFSVNGKYAPFALGIAKGFYVEQQIALKMLEGRGSLAAVQLVANKSDPFAFADSTATISIAAGGAPVVCVGVLQQRSPIAAYSFKSLKQPADLYGLSLGLNPVGVGTLWAAFAARNNLDLTKIKIITMDGPGLVAAVVAGRLDSAIGVANGDGAAAPILANKQASYLYFSDFGTSTLSHGIVVHRDMIKEQPDLVRRFMAATVKSWNYAINNKSEAVDALAKEFPDARKDILARQFDATIPLIHTANSASRPMGFVVEQDINDTFKVLSKFGDVKNIPRAADVFTNDFLPKSVD
jgi:NitT/TauT family transport system substrate-binding protein